MIAILLVLLGLYAFANSNLVKYLRLRALPCQGVYMPGGVYSEYLRAMRLKTKLEVEEGYVKADRVQVPSFFLSVDNLMTETIDSSQTQTENGDPPSPSYVLKDIVPIPVRSVRDDICPSIMAAMSDDATGSNMYAWTAAAITDRDRGFFDNLSAQCSSWLKIPDFKRRMYDVLRLSGSAKSPHHSLVDCLGAVAKLRVTGLIIEVADSPDELSLSLGAAVMVAKEEHSKDWKLSSKNYRQLTKEERRSSQAKIVDCYLDEAFGLHLATGLPIYIAESLYRRVCMDGLLESRGNGERDSRGISISAPYFSSVQDSKKWGEQLEESRARPARVVVKAGDVPDASSFFRMRLSEKRACLRASGVFNLPRPREGAKRVDAIMIPLLDEEVAYEVLRRLGETRGDYELAAKMQDFETRRPLLARLYNEANRQGNRARARELVDEMNSLSMLYYDPNNPDEASSEGFDIEEWYWAQRKRVYGIIAA